MTAKSIILPATNAPALANYPHAKQVGQTIYLSGISSRNPDNKTWKGVTERADGSVDLDIREQSRAVIENIKTILASVGSGLEALVDVTVYLVDMKDYKAFNEVYNEYFTAESGPVRTCVGVRELPHPNLLVELKSVAFLS